MAYPSGQMKRSKRLRYLSRAEERRVVDAIRAAERGNRGEVRVHLEARYAGDGPLERAAALFDALDMGATRDGTGVLLYAAVEDRKAAVWAGPGIHGATEPGFWQATVDEVVVAGFRAGDGASGLVRALERIGDLLRAHAPGEDTAGNELPDEVTSS